MGAGRRVRERARDDQLALAADLHPGYALVPAGDDLAETEVDRERLVAVAAGGELPAVAPPSGVLHGHAVVADDGCACPDDEVDALETVGIGYDPTGRGAGGRPAGAARAF